MDWFLYTKIISNVQLNHNKIKILITNILIFCFRGLYGSGRGFNIIVHQHECAANQHLLDTCGGIFYGSNLELLSPGYPNLYPNNIDCAYTLKRANDGICQFMVTFFNSALEESKGCIKDKLVIEEDILCGNLVGSRRYSMNTDLNIRFITDSNQSNKGFRIIVEQIKCTDITSETIAKHDEVTPYPLHKLPYPQFLEPQINPSIAPQAPSQYLCCGRVYNDKHFLLISPGFPKSQPSDCLYTITKYNPSTYQLRLQFIFFWIDEQNNNNQYCENEFLEIDGKRYCGCKTGLILTSTFQEDWEIEKVIRLKTNYISNRPFSGFVVEVFQDEYTLPRQKRSNETQGTFSKEHYTNYVNENLNQNSNSVLLKTPFAESISNRNFQTTTTQDLPYVWDPIQKFWTLSQNFLCLRWGVSDWVTLVREFLWSQYKCPGTSNNEVSSTPSPIYLPQYGYGYTNVYRKCCY